MRAGAEDGSCTRLRRPSPCHHPVAPAALRERSSAPRGLHRHSTFPHLRDGDRAPSTLAATCRPPARGVSSSLDTMRSPTSGHCFGHRRCHVACPRARATKAARAKPSPRRDDVGARLSMRRRAVAVAVWRPHLWALLHGWMYFLLGLTVPNLPRIIASVVNKGARARSAPSAGLGGPEARRQADLPGVGFLSALDVVGRRSGVVGARYGLVPAGRRSASSGHSSPAPVGRGLMRSLAAPRRRRERRRARDQPRHVPGPEHRRRVRRRSAGACSALLGRARPLLARLQLLNFLLAALSRPSPPASWRARADLRRATRRARRAAFCAGPCCAG